MNIKKRLIGIRIYVDTYMVVNVQNMSILNNNPIIHMFEGLSFYYGAQAFHKNKIK